jgi:hypothetical protein
MVIKIKGYNVLIDDDDYELINDYKWFKLKVKNTSDFSKVYFRAHYGYNNGKQVIVLLHRLIMGNPSNMVIDHINGDILDNRKCNLRQCKQSDNRKNSIISRNSSSGYKGVSWHRATKKWRSRITLNKKQIVLGYFNDKEEAYIAYCNAAPIYHGEFARI